MTKTSPKDLKVRTLSSIVMLALAGGALWAGGWVFTALVVAVALGLLWEWWGLISKFNASWWGRALWMVAGVIYIGVASGTLDEMKRLDGAAPTLHFGIVTAILGLAIWVDTGAYVAGRFIGGPKLLPSISPSKTWAGFFGGLIGGAGWMLFVSYAWGRPAGHQPLGLVMVGLTLAIFAQLGDFFESWMKRLAGVKDSGRLIPGHGGLFDRLDGLAAIAFVIGIIPLAGLAWADPFTAHGAGSSIDIVIGGPVR